MADGRLKRICRRWHIWDNGLQALVEEDPPEVRAGMAEVADDEPPPADAVDKDIVYTGAQMMSFSQYFPILLQSAGMTVLLSVASMAVAMVLGLLIAICRLYGPTPIRLLALLYVEVFRGIPLLLLLFFMYYTLNQYLEPYNMTLPAWLVAILGFGLNYAAFEAEIYRSAITSVPQGQWEAGQALGMADQTIFNRIILPQAIRTALPPMANDFIALFKDTSLVSVIAVTELTKQYLILARSTLMFVEIGLVTALLYLIMSIPLGVLARYLEKRWATGV
jgi:polar amino acid transport system substrate-binding protein